MRDLEPRERKLSKNRIPSVLARFVRELQRFRKMTSFQIEKRCFKGRTFIKDTTPFTKCSVTQKVRECRRVSLVS